MVRRFHSDPRVQATEPLLQERVPRFVPVIRPRPAESTRVEPPVPAVSPRRFRSPHTLLPERALPLERPVHHRRHQRRRRREQLARTRRSRGSATTRPAIRAASSSTCATCAAALLWSATHQPVCREPERYRVTFRADERAVRAHGRRHRDAARDHGVARGRRRGAPRLARSITPIGCARSRSRAWSRSCSRRRPTTSRTRRSSSCSSRPSTGPSAPRCCAAAGRARPTS